MSSGGNAELGRRARLEVRQSGSSGAYQPIGGLTSLSAPETLTEAECTNFDSAGDAEYLQDEKSMELTFDANFLPFDPGQALVRLSKDTRVKLEFQYYEDYLPGSGKPFQSGTCFTRDYDRTSERGSVTTISVTLRASGVSAGTQ